MAKKKKRNDRFAADWTPSVEIDRIESIRDVVEQYYELWLVYPDLFVDMITPKDSNFSLYFYQRVYLRACFRHRYFFATFNK